MDWTLVLCKALKVRNLKHARENFEFKTSQTSTFVNRTTANAIQIGINQFTYYLIFQMRTVCY